jgi:Bacterial Ig-like domain
MNHMGLDDVKTSTGGPDTTPPETYVTSGYGHVTPAVACITDSTSNTFEFSSNEQGSTFKCQLSKLTSTGDQYVFAVIQAWSDCTSPKSYSNLSRNESYEELYRFEVQATDPAGNVDPTPVNRYWFIERGTDTQPPIDSTGPAVMSTVPEANATGVAPTTNVTASFSEEMASASLTKNQNFSLWYQENGSWNQVPASVTLSTDGKTATLNPSSDLKANTTYQTNFWVGSDGVTDKAGNALSCTGAPFLSCWEEVWLYWSFTTLDNTTPPPDLTTPAAPTNLTATVGAQENYHRSL